MLGQRTTKLGPRVSLGMGVGPPEGQHSSHPSLDTSFLPVGLEEQMAPGRAIPSAILPESLGVKGPLGSLRG